MSLHQKLHQNHEFSVIIYLYFLSLDCQVVSKIFCSSPPASESSAEHCHTKQLIACTAELCRWSGEREETATTQERGKGRPETGRVSRATGKTALWKWSRRGNCCRRLGQRWEKELQQNEGRQGCCASRSEAEGCSRRAGGGVERLQPICNLLKD